MSQLMAISDQAYASGLRRIEAALARRDRRHLGRHRGAGLQMGQQCWLDLHRLRKEQTAPVCRRFSDGRTTGFVAEELQADEIRSFTGGKTRPTWVFAVLHRARLAADGGHGHGLGSDVRRRAAGRAFSLLTQQPP